jgi:hypothetical protein
VKPGVFLIALLFVTGPVFGADPLGFYFGGALGRSTLRTENVALVTTRVGFGTQSPSFGLDQHDTGWKVQLGARPVSLLGVEVEYVDFGDSTTSGAQGPEHDYVSYYATSRARAATAFAVIYAPIPLPFLDAYAKAGAARLYTNTRAVGSFGCLTNCPLSGNAPSFYRNETTTRFAYTVGAQMKVGPWALRGEYERINANTGSPDLLSLGATWSF